tara:strand:+ start:3321 stop:4004 length:684 start_codon:yes stop_codon:yes gene_type:complete
MAQLLNRRKAFRGGGGGPITLESDDGGEGHTGYSSPYNVVVKYPAVSVNDIMIAFIVSDVRRNLTSSPPSGWTKVLEQDGNQAYEPTQAIYWKRATAAAAATNETWTNGSSAPCSYYAWVGAYSGCPTVGDPIDASGGRDNGYSTWHPVTVTTLSDNAMIIAAAGTDRNNITTTWSDGTELIDLIYRSTGTISINEKLEATAGTHTRGATLSGANHGTQIAVALKPA